MENANSLPVERDTVAELTEEAFSYQVLAGARAVSLVQIVLTPFNTWM
jgi:hypothetical protein